MTRRSVPHQRIVICDARWREGANKGLLHLRHKWVDGKCQWCGRYKEDVVKRKETRRG